MQLGFQYASQLFIQGELFTNLSHGRSDLGLGAFEVPGGHADALGDLLHFSFAQAAGGDGGGADADTGSDGELLGITGDGVLVQGA